MILTKTINFKMIKIINKHCIVISVIIFIVFYRLMKTIWIVQIQNDNFKAASITAYF